MEQEIAKVEEVKTTEKVESTGKNSRRDSRKSDRKPREPRAKQPKLYEEEVISIGRVTKVTKGGRHFRFSAVVES